MANDETWAAKVSPELKDEISQLVKESGLSSKEFLEQLISSHKIGLLQGTDAQRSEDIQQVTYHLDKVKASFIGLVEKGIDLKDKFTESLAQESVLHKGIVNQQQQQIKLAQDDRDKAVLDKAGLESLMAEIATRNEELEMNSKTHQITIQMQQEKLDQLEGRIGAAQALEDEVSQLKKQALSQTERIQQLEQEALGYKRELEQAQTAQEAQGKDATKALEQLAQVHELGLQKATLETEKRLLDENHKIKEEYFLKLEALTNKNQELIERLHQKELETPKAKTKPKATPE